MFKTPLSEVFFLLNINNFLNKLAKLLYYFPCFFKSINFRFVWIYLYCKTKISWNIILLVESLVNLGKAQYCWACLLSEPAQLLYQTTFHTSFIQRTWFINGTMSTHWVNVGDEGGSAIGETSAALVVDGETA